MGAAAGAGPPADREDGAQGGGVAQGGAEHARRRGCHG